MTILVTICDLHTRFEIFKIRRSKLRSEDNILVWWYRVSKLRHALELDEKEFVNACDQRPLILLDNEVPFLRIFDNRRFVNLSFVFFDSSF